MPYIKKEDRLRLEKDILELGSKIKTEGELNYCFTMLALIFMKSQVMNYSLLNKVVGVFECAKNEFYRRFVVPYENEKIKENGDIIDEDEDFLSWLNKR